MTPEHRILATLAYRKAAGREPTEAELGEVDEDFARAVASLPAEDRERESSP